MAPRCDSGPSSARNPASGGTVTDRHATPNTEGDVREALHEFHGIVGLLEGASRTDRADLYQRLGLELEYEREAATGREIVRARSQLCRGGGTVQAHAAAPPCPRMCR